MNNTFNASAINMEYVIDKADLITGGQYKYDIYELTSKVCEGIYFSLYKWAIIMLVLYMIINLLQNKLDRGKWFSDETRGKFLMWDMEFKKSFPFVKQTFTYTSIKEFCYEYIIPIMKMVLYALLMYNIYITYGLNRGI